MNIINGGRHFIEGCNIKNRLSLGSWFTKVYMVHDLPFRCFGMYLRWRIEWSFDYGETFWVKGCKPKWKIISFGWIIWTTLFSKFRAQKIKGLRVYYVITPAHSFGNEISFVDEILREQNFLSGLKLKSTHSSLQDLESRSWNLNLGRTNEFNGNRSYSWYGPLDG